MKIREEVNVSKNLADRSNDEMFKEGFDNKTADVKPLQEVITIGFYGQQLEFSLQELVEFAKKGLEYEQLMSKNPRINGFVHGMPEKNTGLAGMQQNPGFERLGMAGGNNVRSVEKQEMEVALAEFLEMYPDVREFPAEVLEEISRTGYTPLKAYQKYLLEQKEAELKELKQLQKNRLMSPGSVRGQGGNTDAFITEFMRD